MNHYYVFCVQPHGNVYERTCGTEAAAERRVSALRKRHLGAFYMLNALPEVWWY